MPGTLIISNYFIQFVEKGPLCSK